MLDHGFTVFVKDGLTARESRVPEVDDKGEFGFAIEGDKE